MGKTIHIAGTNGKGSTTHFLGQLLQNHGFQVGTFSSPHLHCYTERIRINGVAISLSELEAVIDEILMDQSSDYLTEFELLTVAGMLIFSRQHLDFVILEVGLGGRLDSTNVCQPILALITHIGLDHCELLGDTLAKIAAEKAGIIKPKTPVIVSRFQDPVVLATIASIAKTQNAPFYQSLPHQFQDLETIENHGIVAYQHENLDLVETAYQYLHQQGLVPALSNRKIQAPLGRFQIIQKPQQLIIKDVAHNPSGIQALLKSLTQRFSPQTDIGFLIGIGKQKDAAAMLHLLTDYPCYYCEFDQTIAWSFEALSSEFPQLKRYDLASPLPSHAILVITGSFYFIEAMDNAQSY